MSGVDAIYAAAKWLDERRDETWNGGEKRPSNYARAANDLRAYASSIVRAMAPTDDTDTAHAVALEREKAATWLEGHATCGNCDGRLCMGCIFREYDHTCAEDCPDCCVDGQMIDPGSRLAARLRNGDHWKDGA